jgi:hypothetical protein
MGHEPVWRPVTRAGSGGGLAGDEGPIIAPAWPVPEAQKFAQPYQRRSSA